MNHDEKYRAWKERPIALNIPPDFAGEVMRRVHRDAGQRPDVPRSIWGRLRRSGGLLGHE